MAIKNGEYRDLKLKQPNKEETKMANNHQTEYDIYIQSMSEDSTQHKLRKSRVLLKHSINLLDQAYDELQFGVGKTRPSNDELK